MKKYSEGYYSIDEKGCEIFNIPYNFVAYLLGKRLYVSWDSNTLSDRVLSMRENRNKIIEGIERELIIPMEVSNKDLKKFRNCCLKENRKNYKKALIYASYIVDGAIEDIDEYYSFIEEEDGWE